METNQEDYSIIKIKEKTFKLKITLGFWKRCGFKKEEAQLIQDDPEVYFTALKLALFYGNKNDYAWSNLEDMAKILPDDVLEELEEDYSENLSMGMVYYLPRKLRKVIMDRINSVRDNVSKVVEAAMDETEQIDPIQSSVQSENEKKN